MPQSFGDGEMRSSKIVDLHDEMNLVDRRVANDSLQCWPEYGSHRGSTTEAGAHRNELPCSKGHETGEGAASGQHSRRISVTRSPEACRGTQNPGNFQKNPGTPAPHGYAVIVKLDAKS